MRAIFTRTLVALVAVCVARGGYAAQSEAAILQFARAVDSYVFAQWQDERRGIPPAPSVEGRFFTPLVSSALRTRIRAATLQCDTPGPGEGSFVVPAVNGPASGAMELPQCINAALPHLPSPLEYRAAGMTLLLVDTHRNIVLDVLHAAFS